MKQLIHTTFACFVAFALGACTPEIRSFASSEWHAMKTFDYSGTLSKVSGFNERFPNFNAMATKADSTMCVHEDSEERVLTMNGVNDQVNYRRCTMQPYLENKPQRFAGR